MCSKYRVIFKIVHRVRHVHEVQYNVHTHIQTISSQISLVRDSNKDTYIHSIIIQIAVDITSVGFSQGQPK